MEAKGVCFADREQALAMKTTKSKRAILFLTKYSTLAPSLPSSILQHWLATVSDHSLTRVFPERPGISYLNHHNLRSPLTRTVVNHPSHTSSLNPLPFTHSDLTHLPLQGSTRNNH